MKTTISGIWRFTLLSMLSGLFTMGGLAGCTISDGGDGNINFTPFITHADVNCFYDPDFLTYGWDFFAHVDDRNGPLDVVNVSVDVIDVIADPFNPVETWFLAYDGGGDWSQTVYEYNGSGNPADYSHYLDCNFPADFDFDFFAIDRRGATDVLTITVVP